MTESLPAERASPIDPTQNVKELIALEVRRLDDLRTASSTLSAKLREAESRRVDEQSHLRADYEQQLRQAESERINAIRAVDVNAVAVASERQAAAATALASQVIQSAEVQRTLVSSTATTIATQLAQITSQLTERLALVERAQYEGAGRRTEQDPQMVRMLAAIEALSTARAETSGTTSGNQQAIGWAVGAVALVATLLSIAGMVVAFTR